MGLPIDLLEAARRAQANAHAPYSNFRVGCALRTASGAIVAGCNVENAAYPQGSCAERGAASAMVAGGETRIVEALVMGSGPEPCTPCGGCRQVLREFMDLEGTVHCVGEGGRHLNKTLRELLPDSFGPGDLDGDPSQREGFARPGSERSAAELLGQGDATGSAPNPHETSRITNEPENAEEVVRQRLHGFQPRLALILGSGLGAASDLIEAEAVIAYAELPGLPRPSVQGHGGRLKLGRLAGLPVACFEGRAHVYEGDAKAPLRLVRFVKDLGCEALLVTSAVGGIREGLKAGSLVRVSDHLNLMGVNPLIGPNDEAYGPRFPDLTGAHDAILAMRLRAAAGEAGVALEEGVFAGWAGPSFETPAEIRMMRTLGADVVGMSVVPEAIAAAHCGLAFAALSIVVNRAAGLEDAVLSHDETLARAGEAAPKLAGLLTKLAEAWPRMREG